MPKRIPEIGIYKPDSIPKDQYLVTYKLNSVKTVKALTADKIGTVIGSIANDSTFANMEKERSEFVTWLLSAD